MRLSEWGSECERESERAVAGRDVTRTHDKRVHYAMVGRELGKGSGKDRAVRECRGAAEK